MQIPIPPEYAWIVPIVVPFLIGLLAGVIIKKAVKLILAVTALLVVLIATGYLHMTFEDIWGEAMKFLPRLYESGKAYLDILPYSSAAFLIGLVLALWKA